MRLHAATAAVSLALIAPGPPSSVRAQADLDAFMQQVMARRDDNWQKLQQFVLDEREDVEVRSDARALVYGERRDYTWYIRDGVFVRSPVRVNGAAVGEADSTEIRSRLPPPREGARGAARDRRSAVAGPRCRRPDPADEPAAVHLHRLFPAVPVRGRRVRARRPRDAGGAGGAAHRVLPDEAVLGPFGFSGPNAAGTSATAPTRPRCGA